MNSDKKKLASSTNREPVDWGLLSDSVSHLARRIHQKAQAVNAEAFEALDMTTFQLGILELADRNSFLTQRRLADLILVDPSVIVGAVDELERRDLIVRRRAAEDRRVYILETTLPGRKLLARAQKVEAAVEDRLTQGLSATQREQLLSAMRHIAEI